MVTLLNTNVPNDKSDTFNAIQLKYFSEILDQSDSITLTRDQFQTICNDCHEHGRLRERALKGNRVRLS